MEAENGIEAGERHPDADLGPLVSLLLRQTKGLLVQPPRLIQALLAHMRPGDDQQRIRFLSQILAAARLRQRFVQQRKPLLDSSVVDAEVAEQGRALGPGLRIMRLPKQGERLFIGSLRGDPVTEYVR